jgi:hypothetical protein
MNRRAVAHRAEAQKHSRPARIRIYLPIFAVQEVSTRLRNHCVANYFRLTTITASAPLVRNIFLLALGHTLRRTCPAE